MRGVVNEVGSRAGRLALSLFRSALRGPASRYGGGNRGRRREDRAEPVLGLAENPLRLNVTAAAREPRSSVVERGELVGGDAEGEEGIWIEGELVEDGQGCVPLEEAEDRVGQGQDHGSLYREQSTVSRALVCARPVLRVGEDRSAFGLSSKAISLASPGGKPVGPPGLVASRSRHGRETAAGSTPAEGAEAVSLRALG